MAHVNRVKVFGELLVVALLAACTSHIDRVATDALELQPYLDSIRGLGVPGVLAEAVIEQTHIAASSGDGDVQSSSPMPVGAHFRIASNTKTFVATVVLQLVGEGELSLDDSVDKWLPGLVTGNGNDGSRITVRNLLQHTSGLVDYGADLPIRSAADWERERFRAYKPEDLVAMSIKHSPSWLPDPDEKRFLYGNVNYVLAGMIIEKVTGRSWETEVHERIVLPLHLSGTVAPGTSPSLPPPFVHSYYRFGPDAPLIDTTSFNPSVVDAAGAMISTTSDMNTLLRALVAGRLLLPPQLAEMQRTIDAPPLHDLYPRARYGLGLMWRPLNCGGGYWSHVGEGAAGATRNGVTPDGSSSIVVFISTELIMPDDRMQQERAVAQLIDHVLCARQEP